MPTRGRVRPEQVPSGTWVIVPAHNEVAVVRSTVFGLSTHFKDIVVVDDGSSDETGAEARAAGATVVRHLRNLGQGAALSTGLRFALGDQSACVFVTFDADGQHRPQDAARMVEVQAASGCSVVFGTRFGEGSDVNVPAARRLVLAAARRQVNRSSGLQLSDARNGLRVLDRRAAELMRFRQRGMAHATEIAQIVGRHGLTHCEVPITVDYTEYARQKGQPMLNAVNILFDQYLRRR